MNINNINMKNYLIILLISFAFISCKDNKPNRPEPATQEQTTKSNPTKKEGNTITQKVTVGAQSENTNIDAKTALAMIANDKNIKVLDVRTPKEIKEGSYPNSIKLDFNSKEFKTGLNSLDKNDTYIVYCKSGGRSKKTVSRMKAIGFSKVYNMKEGFEALDKASK